MHYNRMKVVQKNSAHTHKSFTKVWHYCFEVNAMQVAEKGTYSSVCQQVMLSTDLAAVFYE